MPPASLLIRGIGELVTCDPERGKKPGVLRNAFVLADGETIVGVGNETELRDYEIGPDCLEIDAQGCAVIPGFVDAHSHLIWLGERSNEYAQRAAGVSYQQVAASGGGIGSTVRATQAGSLEELVQAARPRAQRMIAGGTTTVEIKSGYGLNAEAEMRQLDAALRLAADTQLPEVVTTYLPLHAAPDEDRAAFLDAVCHDGLAQAFGRATFVDAFCETGAYSVEECGRLFTSAKQFGLRAKVHAEQLSHTGGAQLAAQHKAVSADHLEHTNAQDHRAMAAAGVVGVLLPGASLVLGGPPPPGRQLIDAAVTVAIATDCNPGTCYSENISLMVSLAVATCGLTPAEALVAATAGGAAALALTDRGVISSGMRCDLVILRTNNWLDVAYHLGANEVNTVVRGGKITCASQAI